MNIMYLSHLLQITFVMWIGYLVAWMPYTILSLLVTYSRAPVPQADSHSRPPDQVLHGLQPPHLCLRFLQVQEGRLGGAVCGQEEDIRPVSGQHHGTQLSSTGAFC